jgi:cobaltochelatase CobN
MHLLLSAGPPEDDPDAAVDLGQTPAPLLFLSAADTDLALVAGAQRRLTANSERWPALRAANLMALAHNLSVDTYIDRMSASTRVIVMRLLGGRGYWRFGVDRMSAMAAETGADIAFLPGDEKPDGELKALSTVSDEVWDRLWGYLKEGGPANADALIETMAGLAGLAEVAPAPPETLARAGLYSPASFPPLSVPLPPDGGEGTEPRDFHLNTLAPRRGERAGRGGKPAATQTDRPIIPILFYRAHVAAGNTAAVDALANALADAGLQPQPIFIAGLKDPASQAFLAEIFAETPPAAILCGLGFAARQSGASDQASPLDQAGVPVLQIVFSGGAEAAWRESAQGLGPRDVAMHVALPELDGRILTRAVSFKSAPQADDLVECPISRYEPLPDRARFVARLAAAWARLSQTPAADRRVAIVVANYPVQAGRVANGVGLDTPASVARSLQDLAKAGYAVTGAPDDGKALMAALAEPLTERLSLVEYLSAYNNIPAEARAKIEDRWGQPEADPLFDATSQTFAVNFRGYGAAAVGVQPSRGYELDPDETHHDPALPPPHGYLAFYIWLREAFVAHAAIHFGKHGNMEWLPGKALALSDACFPEAVFGPVPHIYPFIVNDPGEGAQAKRRSAAVIIDHLTPPMTRAGAEGRLGQIEALADEYFAAAGMDRRRLKPIADKIRDLAAEAGLDADANVSADDDDAAAVSKLDAALCDIKLLQIRDGLHIFGQSPEGSERTGLLAALARAPRGQEAGEASLLRALAEDLALGEDPLTADPSTAWDGPRPNSLASQSDRSWRTVADTVERLDMLSSALINGDAAPEPEWTATAAVLATIDTTLAPAIDACGAAETAGLLAALDGAFIEPGPSGAPTRGRPDVLPTGRNFFSLDPRALPTPTAWTLGQRSAAMLIERFVQDHGDWPKALLVTCWGTANMRTGGDDLAQALALLGVQPEWDRASGRVTGITPVPLAVLGRPRVDVTLRVSGLFRDAFPSQIALFDQAVRTVAALDEPADQNPIAAAVADEATRLQAAGAEPKQARRRAAWRVFGAMPGAYGAGLQAPMQSGAWTSREDLADLWRTWGGYAYGGGEGQAAGEALEARLKQTEGVVQNQDNREHDLLDSDDYFQFEGGAAAAIEAARAEAPAIYHMDHSLPEQPKARSLAEELGRVVHGRAANPRWIRGVMRHGYKGAFEMAATVDYLFGFAATTNAVGPKHFDALFQAYLEDDDVRAFIERENPAALAEMAARFQEAIDRDLWRPRRNSRYETLADIRSAP